MVYLGLSTVVETSYSRLPSKMPPSYGVDELLALDLPPVVGGLDDDVAVGVEAVAGVDGLDRKVVVDVGERAVHAVAVEADVDLAVLLGDVEGGAQLLGLDRPALAVLALISSGSERAPLAFFAAVSASAVVTSGSSTSPLRRAFPLMSSMALSTLAMVAARFNS